jgi:hypothetical protein
MPGGKKMKIVPITDFLSEENDEVIQNTGTDYFNKYDPVDNTSPKIPPKAKIMKGKKMLKFKKIIDHHYKTHNHSDNNDNEAEIINEEDLDQLDDNMPENVDNQQSDKCNDEHSSKCDDEHSHKCDDEHSPKCEGNECSKFKHCSKCRAVKRYCHFGINKSSSTGRDYACRQCLSNIQNIYLWFYKKMHSMWHDKIN